jgi:hypothetical protein
MTCVGPITASIVNITTSNNVTFQDALRFGVEGDTTWSFSNKTFEMQVKASRDDDTPLTTFTSGAGEIVVDDVVQRVLHFNVPEATIIADLPVAVYVYDFLMIDNSVVPVRTMLMQGTLTINRGVTES